MVSSPWSCRCGLVIVAIVTVAVISIAISIAFIVVSSSIVVAIVVSIAVISCLRRGGAAMAAQCWRKTLGPIPMLVFVR